jgi:glycosyltransferase involved in cell wall biosynthesis
VAAALPPRLDGIGDYTAHLASALRQSCDVTILTARGQQCAPIPDVAVETAFSLVRPDGIRELERAVAVHRPDWLLLQYNPFSYGRWGLNPYLPWVLRALRRTSPGLRLALMVHEPFVPVLCWKRAIMTSWQRWQLWMLGRGADRVFSSTEAWARRLRGWFPGTPVGHLPVGSNIPWVRTSRAAARHRLGIPEERVILGLFGTAHDSRVLGRVTGAMDAIRESAPDAMVLYMGPHGHSIRQQLGNVPLLAEGPLPADEVSRRFAALDVYLAPFVDGVSTRRTTLMTGLQHGVATVGTRGVNTDTMIRREDGRALLLADVAAADRFSEHVRRLLADAALRERLGGEARRLYCREFAWDRLASRLLSALGTDGVAR